MSLINCLNVKSCLLSIFKISSDLASTSSSLSIGNLLNWSKVIDLLAFQKQLSISSYILTADKITFPTLFFIFLQYIDKYLHNYNKQI